MDIPGGELVTLNAKKAGDTITAAGYNELLTLQPFSVIYAGSQRCAKAGAGTTENSVATNSYCDRFTLTGATTLGRVELEIDKDGTGQDLMVQIRSGMVPGSGTDGTLLKEVVVPKEFIGTTAGWISVPINLTGLTAGAQYWIVVVKAGDATNKLDWVGEASQDGSYPCFYRAGTSGNWTSNNALHFKAYSNDPADGQDNIKHAIFGTNLVCSFDFDSNGLITKSYRYLPPADGVAGGIRSALAYSMSGDYFMGGS